MNTAKSAIVQFEELPAKTRKRLHLVGPVEISGAVLMKDKIYGFFKATAKHATEVKRFKRSQGYCGGEVACLAYVGHNQTICEGCSNLARLRRQNLKEHGRKMRVSDYGRMRAQERKEEQAERARLGKP
jgi:hypothetical protein